MDSGASWLLSRIWFWAKNNPSDIGPLGVFLPLGLYGKMNAHLSLSQLTAKARRLHSSLLHVHVDYISGREAILRGSLGRSSDVRIMSFPLLLDDLQVSALWLSPYTWSRR
jgi:hypothetical protein